eukprot:753067-Hanusia_phi.AAC.5
MFLFWRSPWLPLQSLAASRLPIRLQCWQPVPGARQVRVPGPVLPKRLLAPAPELEIPPAGRSSS